jgi:hypothetical protein
MSEDRTICLCQRQFKPHYDDVEKRGEKENAKKKSNRRIIYTLALIIGITIIICIIIWSWKNLDDWGFWVVFGTILSIIFLLLFIRLIRRILHLFLIAGLLAGLFLIVYQSFYIYIKLNKANETDNDFYDAKELAYQMYYTLIGVTLFVLVLIFFGMFPPFFAPPVFKVRHPIWEGFLQFTLFMGLIVLIIFTKIQIDKLENYEIEDPKKSFLIMAIVMLCVLIFYIGLSLPRMATSIKFLIWFTRTLFLTCPQNGMSLDCKSKEDKNLDITYEKEDIRLNEPGYMEMTEFDVNKTE